jgi:cellulose synthase/poly-beta-1,6-N-acetylglucosamine synthase-like glycosyltransferase
VLEGTVFQYLWIVWLVSSLALVRVYIYVFTYRSRMIAKSPRDRFATPRIIFQITTKGNIPIVQNSINRVNVVCKEIGYEKFEIWVVTDEQEEFRDCRTITVPKSYSCNAIYKGRALQYAVEVRRAENKNTDDLYVFHLDDESLITKQTLCSVLSYLEDSPTPVSEGLIVYPLQKEERITITHLLDTLRPFCCFECLDFMNNGHPAFMHGSNLLARSDVEEKVGWENGKTISEDSLFAINARTKCGEGLFGWHGGVIEEKSPLSLRDFVKQRKRWFYGLVQNLKFFSYGEKVSQSARAIVWSLGFFSGLISVVSLVIPQTIPFPIRVAFFGTTLLWLFSYQIGAFFNSRYLSARRRVWFHFLVLVSSFVLGIIESAVPFLALINRPKTFEVVRK